MEQFTINTDGNDNFVASFAGVHYPLWGDWEFEMNDNLVSKEVIQPEAPLISLKNYFEHRYIDTDGGYTDIEDAFDAANEWNEHVNVSSIDINVAT